MKKSLLLIMSFLWCSLPVSLVHGGIQVRGIKVDVQSKSGLQARELAIADARRKAFIDLIQNNSTFFYDLQTKGMPTDDALESAVDTFEIEEEKISAKQYIGTLSITFSDHGLRRLLSGQADQKETAKGDSDTSSPSKVMGPESKNVILVPIYLTTDESLLWHSKNPWNSYWQTAPQENIFKTLLPLGDVQDIMGTSIEDIMTGRYQRVRALLDRYGKDALVVAILKRVSLEHHELELTVKLFHKERLVFSSESLFVEGTTSEDAFSKARTELIKVLQDQSASLKETEHSGLQLYQVTATFNSFAQWQQIRRGLKTGAIRNFDVLSLSRTYAKIVLKSNLAFNILASELARKGLVLGEGTPGAFTLHVGFAEENSTPQVNSPFQGPVPQASVNEKVFSPKIRSAFEVSS